ncbi:MAG TPA: hypothetical protein VMU92_05905 [Acidobacteriaceae bacterium]|nr:hypothetical protein [Acidobacteriaceae bacterium]
MAKVTIILGVVLVLLGVASFVVTGSQHPTSLIPTAFGLILLVFGFLSLTEDAKKRMLYMHIAVTVGLLGFLGTGWSIVNYFQMLGGRQFPHPIAVEEKSAMAVILLFFVLLSVRSFIAVRRSRA